MTKKIILVGCGNIGSRHLQALTKLSLDLDIDVVEPNENSQKLAQLRLNEISHDNNYNISWHKSTRDLPKQSDLVIVSTTSVDRVAMMNNLIESGHLKFLVEKMVCQSVTEYELLLSKMHSCGAKAWVNTNRRYFEAYKNIKFIFNSSEELHVSVIAGNVGLGSTAIHFVDLFSWLTEDYDVKLNGELLYNKLFPSRHGTNFIEFGGTITGIIKNNSTLLLTFLPYDNLPVVVNIVGNNKYFVINETNETFFDLKNLDMSNSSFKYELTSDLTTKIVKDILEKDDCFLPSLDDSFIAHSELFRIFNNHIKKVINEEKKYCPIT